MRSASRWAAGGGRSPRQATNSARTRGSRFNGGALAAAGAISQHNRRSHRASGAWRSDGGRTSMRRLLGVERVERTPQDGNKRKDLMGCDIGHDAPDLEALSKKRRHG